tara:strand:+ start:219 stop:416 length:198 start_codon:yes stop_codon:yes gene_type:complete
MPTRGFGNSRKKGPKVKYGQGKNPITFKSPMKAGTSDAPDQNASFGTAERGSYADIKTANIKAQS